jgi:hypothetical protein
MDAELASRTAFEGSGVLNGLAADQGRPAVRVNVGVGVGVVVVIVLAVVVARAGVVVGGVGAVTGGFGTVVRFTLKYDVTEFTAVPREIRAVSRCMPTASLLVS